MDVIVKAKTKEARLSGVMDLSCSGMKTIPSLPSDLPLQTLDVNHNELPQLSVSLLSFARTLSKLDLSFNKLTVLPDFISSLTALQQLHVARNPLTALPAGLFRLPRLTSLHVDHCAIAELPLSVGRCTALTVLDVRYNKLQTLPRSLHRLPSLSVLAIEGNPLRGPLLRMRHNTAELLSHLRAQPETPEETALYAEAPSAAAPAPAAAAPTATVAAAAAAPTTVPVILVAPAAKQAVTAAPLQLLDLAGCDSVATLTRVVRAQCRVHAKRSVRVLYSVNGVTAAAAATEVGKENWNAIETDAELAAYRQLVRAGERTKLRVDVADS